MNTVLLVVVIASGLLGLILALVGVGALRRRHALGGIAGILAGLVFLSVGAACLTMSVAMQGYRAFTREETAATITTRPVGPQRFEALFRFADGETRTFEVEGDQLYVDAHIVKWHPIANLLGVHTGYELDRVGGRYEDIEDERQRPRSLYSLKAPKPVDAFALARKYTFLAPLVDAEYGSATFTDARRPAQYELNVSTTGLLVWRIGGVD
jgi:hypothetical protein